MSTYQTIRTINGWTKQSMIDHIKKEFRGKSVGTPRGYGNSCAYRGQNGTKCAVGMFIPDELYVPEMEGLSYVVEVRAGNLFSAVVDKMPLEICEMGILQNIHDTCDEMTCLDEMLSWISDEVQDS